MTKTFVDVNNICKRFGNGTDLVLNNISFTINRGSIFVLLGHSGCGKTTLLRIMAGFEKADSGSITVDGEDILAMPANVRPINIMFQNYALFPHFTVWQNISFGLEQEKLAKQTIKQRLGEVSEVLGLEHLINRYPHQLSGGQQQRVALARSIVKRPKLLLLDEPLGALDKNTREKTRIELIKIQNYLGTTFIVVTHDQEEAMSLANKIGVMQDGRIIQKATPEKIYEEPVNRFVANFIGTMNIFESVVLSNTSDKLLVEEKNLGTKLRIKAIESYRKGQIVYIAIRPEELAISSAHPQNEDNVISGKIIDIEFLGSQIFYIVQLRDNKIIHISVPTSARSKNSNLAVGRTAYVTWHNDDGIVLTA